MNAKTGIWRIFPDACFNKLVAILLKTASVKDKNEHRLRMRTKGFQKGVFIMDIIKDETMIRKEYGDNVLAMASVPVQSWETLYAPDVALMKGTIFPSLDLPFYAADEWIGGVTR